MHIIILRRIVAVHLNAQEMFSLQRISIGVLAESKATSGDTTLVACYMYAMEPPCVDSCAATVCNPRYLRPFILYKPNPFPAILQCTTLSSTTSTMLSKTYPIALKKLSSLIAFLLLSRMALVNPLLASPACFAPSTLPSPPGRSTLCS